MCWQHVCDRGWQKSVVLHTLRSSFIKLQSKPTASDISITDRHTIIGVCHFGYHMPIGCFHWNYVGCLQSSSQETKQIFTGDEQGKVKCAVCLAHI